MSIYIGQVWECETCHQWDKSQPWGCPACHKETCERCFCMYLVCNTCAEGKTEEECKVLGNWVDE